MNADPQAAGHDAPVAPLRFAVCFSGGSGIAYGLRLVEVLLRCGHEVHLCATRAALRVLVHEAGLPVDLDQPDLVALFPPAIRRRLSVHPLEAVEAAPASGSAGIQATIIVPCSMGTLARLGAIVLPAMPGFYHRPQTVQDLVDFVVGKILDRLRVDHPLVRRWQTPPPAATSPWDEGEVP